MSRYTGPRVRVMRALGVDLPGLSAKTSERRPYPPGQHGGNKRGRDSVFGVQLKEKQAQDELRSDRATDAFVHQAGSPF